MCLIQLFHLTVLSVGIQHLKIEDMFSHSELQILFLLIFDVLVNVYKITPAYWN